MRISGEQCKAARALVRITAKRLSEKSGVPYDTIRSFESGRTGKLSTLNNEAVQVFLEESGVIFIPENGGGEGVRFRDRADGSSKSVDE